MNSDDEVHTTHSEKHRPVHVPFFEKFPINVPHPVPFNVPEHVRIGIPQPYPKYNYVRHKIEVPVYRVVPEIIEKHVPEIVEKPFPGRSFTKAVKFP